MKHKLDYHTQLTADTAKQHYFEIMIKALQLEVSSFIALLARGCAYTIMIYEYIADAYLQGQEAFVTMLSVLEFSSHYSLQIIVQLQQQKDSKTMPSWS